jgi:hypothetical protein
LRLQAHDGKSIQKSDAFGEKVFRIAEITEPFARPNQIFLILFQGLLRPLLEEMGLVLSS